MIKKNLLLALAITGTFFTSCKDSSDENQEIETDPIEFTKEAELYLIKAEGDTIQKLEVEIADNDYERETGLMYRTEMAEDRGMLFVYDNASLHNFYMKNTYIPLDLIFYGSDSTAVSFQENATPLDESNLPSGKPAQFILEINAGLVEEWNIEIGDRFSVEEVP
ncbi:DUF192 domain-containing protein [Zunongwangia sp. F363]|uniref:DUF192 domain-containing protein n=1 Tax=Autumnicola tepida TaxID=3075595 RepID=A0ABU3C7V2_9FLAO|nr:DUF192 domain-containing protein [Zunongwangia sp. F363]MDT0642412.1 DUF192 domain-containing protein [Zunongwangia sp. F363]